MYWCWRLKKSCWQYKIISPTILDEWPPIDINDIRDEGITLLNPKDVKAADLLLENQNNPNRNGTERAVLIDDEGIDVKCKEQMVQNYIPPRNFLLSQCQNNWKTNLLPISIPFHLPIHSRTFASFRVPIVRANCVSTRNGIREEPIFRWHEGFVS